MALSTYIFGLEKVLRSNFYVQAFARNAISAMACEISVWICLYNCNYYERDMNLFLKFYEHEIYVYPYVLCVRKLVVLNFYEMFH